MSVESVMAGIRAAVEDSVDSLVCGVGTPNPTLG
ncbi:hypothetical protein LCGC14_3079620, partial [marine sediment metagenome]